MRKIYLIKLAMLFANVCMAQMLRSPLSVRYIGLGAYSKNFTDVFSFTSNQAALSQVKDWTGGVYGERRFMLKELTLYSASLAAPFKSGAAGISINYSGFNNFSESQTGLAYGRSLDEKIDLGLQFNYYTVHIRDYGNLAAFNFEMGTLVHASEKVTVGIHVYNPFGSGKLGKHSNEKLAAVYSMGVGLEASKKLLLSTELGKEENQPVNVNVAFQYAFIEEFFVRGGIATGSNNSYLGAGIKWKTFRTDFLGTYHPQLGFTPTILFIFRPAGTKEQDN